MMTQLKEWSFLRKRMTRTMTRMTLRKMMQLKQRKLMMSLKMTMQQMTPVKRSPLPTVCTSTLGLCAAFAPFVSTALITVTIAPVKREMSRLIVNTAKNAHPATFAPYCVTQFAHQVALLMSLPGPSIRLLPLYSEQPGDFALQCHLVGAGGTAPSIEAVRLFHTSPAA